jgi:hypothetical protein
MGKFHLGNRKQGRVVSLSEPLHGVQEGIQSHSGQQEAGEDNTLIGAT